MTYLEKLKAEHPEAYIQIGFGDEYIAKGCPTDYGYMKKPFCHCINSKVDCYKDCWEREMIVTEKEQEPPTFRDTEIYKMGKARLEKVVRDLFDELYAELTKNIEESLKKEKENG